MIRLDEIRYDNIHELSNHLFRTILNNIYERIIERIIPYYIGADELDNELWVSELNIFVRIKKRIKPLPCTKNVVPLQYKLNEILTN